MKDLWRVTETDEIWCKQWIGYDKKGAEFGGQIILVNASPDLIAAVKMAFNESLEGQKSK